MYATYPSVGRLPHTKHAIVSQILLVFPVDLGRVAQHRGRSSRIVSQKLRQPELVAPPKTLSSPQESERLRKFILAENESQELQHRHATDREVSDPTESASTSAVRSNLALCRTHDRTSHKATCKKGRLLVRRTSPEAKKKPTLGKESPRFRIFWIESAGPGRFSHARF